MLSSAVTTKGQVTVPAELREKLGIKPGDRIGFIEEDGHLVLVPQPQGVAASFGILKAKKSASLARIDAALAERRKRRAGR